MGTRIAPVLLEANTIVSDGPGNALAVETFTDHGHRLAYLTVVEAGGEATIALSPYELRKTIAALCEARDLLEAHR